MEFYAARRLTDSEVKKLSYQFDCDLENSDTYYALEWGFADDCVPGWVDDDVVLRSLCREVPVRQTGFDRQKIRKALGSISLKGDILYAVEHKEEHVAWTSDVMVDVVLTDGMKEETVSCIGSYSDFVKRFQRPCMVLNMYARRPLEGEVGLSDGIVSGLMFAQTIQKYNRMLRNDEYLIICI